MARTDLGTPTTWGAVRGLINTMLTEVYGLITTNSQAITTNSAAITVNTTAITTNTASIATHTTAIAANTAKIASALQAPLNWAAGSNTPTLTSGTAVLGTAYKNTTAGVTTLGTAIDGITVLQQNDLLVCFSTGTYTLVPAGYIAGIFASASALQTAFPAASNAGARALVGASAPYDTYTSNGTAWETGKPLTLASVTYDGSSRVTGYTLNGVAYTVAYPSSTSITVTGGGRVKTITLDSSGRMVGLSIA